ncbi:MAG: 16S rRNA (guanine(966)-N(2))-methyltransferase RsmD [Candidatus Omnitrophica bacterium]|nr:16S rRNA (guanine(966)-N(2))-methyltransferase RsmD [Candidatus Omnitrophota bacterium]
MKIILGQDSGRNIFMPAHIRPTQNLLRKAVFDIIGEDLDGLSFLDLFSGSGAMGFEALSCGATEVCMVERDPKCVECIEENLMIIKPGERGQRAELVTKDVFATIKEMARTERKFHVVFFDPPFDMKLGRKTLKTLLTHDILHANSFLVAQYGIDETLPDLDGIVTIAGKFLLVKDKVYGSSRLTVFERLAPGESV